MPRVSNFLWNSTNNFRTFLYLGTCILRVAVVEQFRLPLLIRLGQIGTCIFDTACNRHSNETVTPRKYVTKHKNIRKWIIEFLRKFENCGIQITWVDAILIKNCINLQLFPFILQDVGVRRDRIRYSVHSPFIEKSMVIVYTLFVCEASCQLTALRCMTYTFTRNILSKLMNVLWYQ